MGTPLVLFGYGNPSRGDDALGPLLLARAEAWAKDRPGVTLTLVEDFQLQIEHAEDLREQAGALFLDADASGGSPFHFRRALPARDASYTTHELSPEALLHVFSVITGQAPPPAFVLSVRGSGFALGEPLTLAATENLDAAWPFLERLLAHGRPELWEERIS